MSNVVTTGSLRVNLTTFGPASIAGLVAWYDASDTATITHVAGAVSQWNDKSGNGHHVTEGTGSRQPITGTRTVNGLNTIDFDGTDDFLGSATFTQAQPVTLYVACKSDDTDNGQHQLLGNAGGIANQPIIYAADTTGEWNIFAGSSVSSGVAEENTQAHVLVGVFDGASSKGWVDSTSFTGDPGSGSLRAIRFGDDCSGCAGGNFNGVICEAIYYAGAHDDTTVDMVMTYLMDKWIPVPQRISGLVAWYDASNVGSITALSGAVSQWNDLSGNGYHVTQGTGSAQPTTGTRTQNGLNVLDFDGGDYLSGACVNASGNQTIFGVVLTDTWGAGNYARWVSCQNSSRASDYQFAEAWPPATLAGNGAADQFFTYNNNAARWYSTVGKTTATPYLLSAYYRDSSQTPIYVNGSSAGHPQTNGTSTLNVDVIAIGVGKDGGVPTAFWDGWIAEIIYYDSDLGDTDRDAVTTYLNQKWAVY